MNLNKFDFYPIMGENLSFENTLKLDFTEGNHELKPVDLSKTEVFNQYVFNQLRQKNKKYGIGGYLEKRAIYRRSEVFATAAAFRNIHLGVDIWTEAGAPVFAPIDGMIHSFQDNAGFGNYGPTIILEHELDGKKLFSLYGHLFQKDLEKLEVGRKIKAGEKLCHVGPFPENGDWPPHLHFQLMWDLGGNCGDYPGVAAEKDLGFYQANCPDPNLILRFSEK
ncbi:MAG: peptidoglycan DD-metalloendopeptidase family protein [Algoriphagus sp.]|uniref:peptidoglycan DD-metalloendopeptidase family protein n=1 Tax=Algoriphagus sp. TaxID=1872435 RepID=UPI0027315043|nr:peptidoglycan DD-metalloendopeptidase family protein [Algoriphagus sp.]MDP2041165.1 peptidoglycan DD-metalloendopeptidase family protein [Algoriphagus sp.]MDP3471790.1 peptidoglycan DD-metalloendopeptidase family protein [Algoriphagus sp.]